MILLDVFAVFTVGFMCGLIVAWGHRTWQTDRRVDALLKETAAKSRTEAPRWQR